MKLLAKIENGKIVPWNPQDLIDIAKKYEGKEIDIVIEPHQETRTPQQNKALHVYFTLLSDALNDAGFDMREVIRESVDIPWTAYNVKEFLWRPVQKNQLGKRSTTDLTTREIDKIYEVINKVIGERTGVHVPFPRQIPPEYQ